MGAVRGGRARLRRAMRPASPVRLRPPRVAELLRKLVVEDAPEQVQVPRGALRSDLALGKLVLRDGLKRGEMSTASAAASAPLAAAPLVGSPPVSSLRLCRLY